MNTFRCHVEDEILGEKHPGGRKFSNGICSSLFRVAGPTLQAQKSESASKEFRAPSGWCGSDRPQSLPAALHPGHRGWGAGLWAEGAGDQGPGSRSAGIPPGPQAPAATRHPVGQLRQLRDCTRGGGRAQGGEVSSGGGTQRAHLFLPLPPLSSSGPGVSPAPGDSASTSHRLGFFLQGALTWEREQGAWDSKLCARGHLLSLASALEPGPMPLFSKAFPSSPCQQLLAPTPRTSSSLNIPHLPTRVETHTWRCHWGDRHILGQYGASPGHLILVTCWPRQRTRQLRAH